LEDSERALCETIQGCAQTLLNTVSHILDYTKASQHLLSSSSPSRYGQSTNSSQVNDFNHRMTEARNERDLSPTGEGAPSAENLSSIALFSDVDVASICESAIQSVCVGSAFGQRISGISVSHEQGLSINTALHSLPDASQAISTQEGSVAVVLYISPGDWAFHCAPGAIQRILMNLVGNSLKYTKSGHIKIKVEEQSKMQYQPEVEKSHSQITITVMDTGIGISKDFLRYKLFTPFSQESAVAAGTGQNLSTSFSFK
jgi:signal transduction histidine kinase